MRGFVAAGDGVEDGLLVGGMAGGKVWAAPLMAMVADRRGRSTCGRWPSDSVSVAATPTLRPT